MPPLVQASEQVKQRLNAVGRLLGNITVISITDYPTGKSHIQACVADKASMHTALYRVQQFNQQGGTDVDIEFVSQAELAPVELGNNHIQKGG
jgi:hypothetical protein